MKNLKENFCEYLTFLLMTALCFLLVIGKGYVNAVNQGLLLFITCVLPTLFPYLFITTMLSNISITTALSLKLSPVTKRVFRVNGACAFAFILGLISGYPIGAKIISDLYDKGYISQTEAVRSSAFCSTPSPMFLISGVGGVMFNNVLIGVFLFFISLTSSIVLGFMFSFYKRKDKPSDSSNLKPQKGGLSFYQTVKNSVISVLTIGGIITLFSLFSEILWTTNTLKPMVFLIKTLCGNEVLAKGVSIGLLECTNGLKILSEVGTSSIPFCALLCGFGGVSVIAQSMAYLQKAKIKTAVFSLVKLLTAVINFVLASIFAPIFF